MHFSNSAPRPHKRFSIRGNETIKRRSSKQVCFISKPWYSLLANIRFTESVVRTGTPSSCKFSMSGPLIRVRLTLRGCQYFKLYSVEIQSKFLNVTYNFFQSAFRHLAVQNNTDIPMFGQTFRLPFSGRQSKLWTAVQEDIVTRRLGWNPAPKRRWQTTDRGSVTSQKSEDIKHAAAKT